MKSAIKKIANSFGYSIVKTSALEKIKGRSNPYLVQKDLANGKQDLCIFDVGAHYGETAENYQNVFPEAKIFSFEPFGDSAAKLFSNTKGKRNIMPFELAFSNFRGNQMLNINSSDATNSLLNSMKTDSWIDATTKTSRAVSVKTDTIDEFCIDQNVDTIDILKIDVQGGELLVLEGAVQMLGTSRIGIIYSEVEFIAIYDKQPLFEDVYAFLSTYHYNLYGFYNTYTTDSGRLAWCDAIFIKNTKV